MQIVTSGSSYLDIDAYGGIIAYAELLQKLGIEAKAVSTAPLNESITPEIRAWQALFGSTYEASDDDTFTLIDISEPEFFDPIVKLDHVAEVIDHHTGNEATWAKLGDSANIEFIGAACTLVYEKWLAANKIADISETSARLLIAGILDNTLNFKAGVTTNRDRAAYADLMKYAQLSEDWPATYFTDCQQAIEQDIKTALRNDTKTMADTTHLPSAMGQIVIWNARELLTDKRSEIAETMQLINEDWAVNVVSIAEGKSYFLANNPETQAKFSRVVSIEFEDGIAEADKLWMRKEVIKRAAEL